MWGIFKGEGLILLDKDFSLEGESPSPPTLYVHKAHHADIKNQHLVIGQLKNPANQKHPALFCFFVIGWCSHIDQSQGTGF